VKKRYASIVRSLLGLLDMEGEGEMILQHINSYLSQDTASHSRRLETSQPIFWDFLNVPLSVVFEQEVQSRHHVEHRWEGRTINDIISQTSQNWVHYECFFYLLKITMTLNLKIITTCIVKYWWTLLKKTKRSYYDEELFTSKNKIKPIWNIVKAVTDRKSVHEDIHILDTDGNLTNNQHIISNSFNDYILSTDRINIKTSNNSKPNRNNSIPMEYLLQTFKKPPPNMKH